MNDNYNYTEYNDEKNTIPWKRIILILAMLIVVVVGALFIIRGCGKTDLGEYLVKAGKDYYEEYPSSLPTEAGECTIVTLADLKENNIIKKANKFETCDGEQTYVKVCYLESKNYHYTPILSCEVETSKFGMWADGDESNLIADKTDVRFKFLGEEVNKGNKYYYPNNVNDATTVNEYYANSPAKDYTGKDEGVTGYKWYSESAGNSYWNNGGYSSTQPDGYTNKGESTTQTFISETKPAEASYRTITNDVALYRYQKVARPMKFYCHATGNENAVSYSDYPCTGDFPELVMIQYTCDGTNEVARGSVCEDYTNYSTEACTSSTTKGIKCESITGYTYVDTLWKWYKNTTVRKYYPSGSSSANGEKTYYVNSPAKGLIKDDATKATVYKYFKLVEEENSTDFEEWLEVTEGYVTEEELISKFKELNYEVGSLKDINSLDKIRYKLQLQYRNVEE